MSSDVLIWLLIVLSIQDYAHEKTVQTVSQVKTVKMTELYGSTEVQTDRKKSGRTAGTT